MKLSELSALLKSLNIPVYYSHTKNNVKAPYIIYYELFGDNFKADNKVYKKFTQVQIELYTKTKDEQMEEQLETVLDDNNLPYDPDYLYIEGENVFQTSYEIRI